MTELDEQLNEITKNLVLDIGAQVTRDYTMKHGIWEGMSIDNNKTRLEANQALSKIIEETAKAYGGCTNCYGKGYATKQSFVSGGGKKWQTSPIKYCSCERGKQLESIIEDREREARNLMTGPEWLERFYDQLENTKPSDDALMPTWIGDAARRASGVKDD